KTVTINISGIIFHIEEDAYNALSNYLSKIKSFFKDSDGRDEIMADIESRIAEILQQKLSPGKQVILMEDVDAVMQLMGKPEQFAGEENADKKEESTSSENQYTTSGNHRKRVFRDEDNKVLGGVCAGVAAYFDFDPIWLRLAFAISFFVFGSGFLFYIILWVIIPKAKTTAEKLEMRGENVNINNIGKSIQEEMENLKKRMDDFTKPENKEKIKNFTQDAGNKLVDFLTSVFGGAFRIIAKIVAGIVIVVGFFITIVLMKLFFWSFLHHDSSHFLISFFNSQQQIYLTVIALFLIIGIPTFYLIYRSFRTILNVKSNHHWLRFITYPLWIIGLLIGFYVTMDLVSSFSESSKISETIVLKQPINTTLYLKGTESKSDDNTDYKSFSLHRNHHNHFYFNGIYFSGISVNNLYANLKIVPSKTDSFQLEVTKTSYGSDKKEAFVFAKDIRYSFIQNDSILNFDPIFKLSDNEKWRNQQLTFILKVPQNKIIFIENSSKNMLDDIDNVTNTYDGDMVNRRWIMTAQGLSCVDCQGIDTTVPRDDNN
ncbi:MAG TPA: PspC domain-containing protein, partial [Bacteroidia bacterium]|nr:PspC domain-containing protein [Bacteroidia bacterium]